MLNPSYSKLIDIANQKIEENDRIESRYSIIIAVSKRAREIVGGAKYKEGLKKSNKAISIAISEIENREISIMPSKKQEIIDIPVIEQSIATFIVDDSFIRETDDLDEEKNEYDEEYEAKDDNYENLENE